MRTLLLICAIFLSAMASAQENNREYNFCASLGTGINLDSPSKTPMLSQLIVSKTFLQRVELGAGAGISVYEKTLLPLFAHAGFKFADFEHIKLGITMDGGGTLIHKGVYLSPSINGRYKIFQLSLGYEYQTFNRIKTNENEYLVSSFKENLHHSTVVFRIGVMF